MLDTLNNHMFGRSIKTTADSIAFFERCHGDKCVIDIYEPFIDIEKHPTTEEYRNGPMYNWLAEIVGNEMVPFDDKLHDPNDIEYKITQRVLINGNTQHADIYGFVSADDEVDRSIEVKAYYPGGSNWMRIEERMANKIAGEQLLTASRTTKRHIFSNMEDELKAVDNISGKVDQEEIYGHLDEYY